MRATHSITPAGVLGRQIALAVVLAALLALGPATARAQEAGQADSLLAMVQNLYDSGSFVSAELEARRLLDQPDLTDEAKILAQQFIAFSLIAQGKNFGAEEFFVSILKADSGYALDPLMTSPKIISVFETARERYRREKDQTVRPAVEAVGAEPAGPSFRLLVFPGWDQIHQGRTVKGTVLVGAGALSLGSLVTFDILRRSAREDYLAAETPSEASDRYLDYNRYHKAEYYSAAALAVVYLYSAFDAFFDLPPKLDARVLPDGSGVQLSIGLPF